MMFGSLRVRLFLMIAGLLVLATILLVMMVNYVATLNSKELIRQDFLTNQYYTQAIVNERFERLRASAVHVASDFAFKAAVNTRNEDTVRSALSTLETRLDADIMVVQSLDGSFLVSLKDNINTSELKPALKPLVASNFVGEHDIKSGIMAIGATVYQTIAVPINAPGPIGYVIVAFALNELFTEDIKALATADITFLAVSRRPETTVKNVYVSTVVDFQPPDMEKHRYPDNDDDSASLHDGMMTRVIRIEQDNPHYDFYVVLQKDWDETLAEYTQFKSYLVFIMLGLIVASAPLVHLIASSVTRPLKQLVNTSEDILDGNYAVARLSINQRDEIGTLALRLEELLQKMTERDKLEFIAFHDFATGLPNRKFINEKMQKALKMQEEDENASALLFVRLVNYGAMIKSQTKEQADALMKQLGEHLMDMSIGEEDIMAKLGDSTFGVLMVGIANKNILQQKAESIIRFLRAPILLQQGGTVEFDVCIGIALSEGVEDPSIWLNMAEAACSKAADDKGVNSFHFHEMKLAISSS